MDLHYIITLQNVDIKLGLECCDIILLFWPEEKNTKKSPQAHRTEDNNATS